MTESEQIEQFIREHGVTRCPPGYACATYNFNKFTVTPEQREAALKTLRKRRKRERAPI